MDEQILEPCPFCGGNDVKLYSPALSRLVAVHCQDCEIRGETAIDTDVAVSNWNTRAAHSVMAGRVAELTEPFANYHGDLPDYDHPMRPVFESGIQYAVELLAKVLKVENWEICDGTEEFDGDLGGTLLNIVIATWPTDEHGDWIDLRDPATRAALAPHPKPENQQ